MEAPSIDKAVSVLPAIPEYSVHLDAIRGSAAVLVFASHLRLFFLQSLTNSPVTASGSVAATKGPPAGPSKDWVDPAHEAVMVFFVLSGFLVGGSVLRLLKQGRWSWKRYLIHRTVRLWMVLLPVLLLGLLLDKTALHHFSGQGTVYTAGPAHRMWEPDLPDRLRPATLLGNVFFLQEIRVSPLGTNQPLWSLTNEFWYYLSFPCLAVALLGRAAPWKRVLSSGAMFALLFFVGHKIAIYFLIWLLGAFAALLPLKIPPRFRRPFVGLACLLFVATSLSALLFGSNSLIVDVLIGAAFFILLYGLLHLRGASCDGWYRRCSRFMSKISYSLYLTHAPVLCLMSAILVGTYRRLPLNGHTLVLLSKVVAVVFLVACVIHFLFEARTEQVRDYLEARL